MNKEIEKRNNLIVKLKESGLTQQAIANKLNLTRQRVQQLEKQLGLKRVRVIKKGFELVCGYSGKKFFSRNKNQKYASREYFYLSRRKYCTPEEMAINLEKKREKNRLKASTYYHSIFKKRSDWKEIVRKRNLKYAVPTTNR